MLSQTVSIQPEDTPIIAGLIRTDFHHEFQVPEVADGSVSRKQNYGGDAG
jgi:hypothetical protein